MTTTMNNGNWVKTLLFTLIGFGLGWAICLATCRCCGTGGHGGCHREMACMGDCKGKCSGECGGRCQSGRKNCCKGGQAHDHHAPAAADTNAVQ